ncbi:MAG: CoA transferase [Gammaproteobacteria bacterium]|nr:CoA transferase [Gammaproteobacteria bacterium]
MANSVPGVLNGITVVDFTQYIAGPVATRLMGEMGAEVIKIELAPNGDPTRAMPVLRNGRSAYFIQQNVGKQSVCLDLRKPEGLEIAKALVARADVLVQNFSPGVMQRFGLGWETVHAINPKLVMCSISAFGQSGPLSDQPGFDYIGQAYAGVTSLIGERGEPPALTGVAAGDVGAGLSAVAAINGALIWARGPDGHGQHIDVSLLDFYFHTHSLAVELHSASGGAVVTDRDGSHHGVIAPLGIFRAREGFLVIIPFPSMWPRVCEAIGRPDLEHDPRFCDNDSRMQNKALLVEIIEHWLAEQPSDAAAIERLQACRVPCAPVLTVPEAIHHPHLIERGTVRTVHDPQIGTFQIPGMAVKLSAHPEPVDRPAPYLGEHNASVLSRLIGYDAARIDVLSDAGVLVAERLPER